MDKLFLEISIDTDTEHITGPNSPAVWIRRRPHKTTRLSIQTGRSF